MNKKIIKNVILGTLFDFASAFLLPILFGFSIGFFIGVISAISGGNPMEKVNVMEGMLKTDLFISILAIIGTTIGVSFTLSRLEKSVWIKASLVYGAFGLLIANVFIAMKDVSKLFTEDALNSSVVFLATVVAVTGIHLFYKELASKLK